MPEESTPLDEIEAIYRHRGADFFRLALAKTGDPEAAHDAVQDGFAQAIRGRGSYRATGPLEAWVARCVINAAHDVRRANAIVARQSELLTTANGTTAQTASTDANTAIVREAVRQLPARQRDALYLRFYLEFEYALVAETLGIEIGTVSATLHAAPHFTRADLAGGTQVTFLDDTLDRLAPVVPWHADWSDVLRRAGEPDAPHLRPRRIRKRRLVVAVVVLAAVLIPLAALAATNDWWFFRLTSAPRPASAPVVVKEGQWSGHPWELIAYPSSTDGLCLSLSPKGSTGAGAMGCSPFAGVSRTAETKASPDMTITYLSGTGGELPSYIVGPVIETAAEVEIRFANGHVLHVPTFAAPAPLEHVRFYAMQTSESFYASPPGRRAAPPGGNASGGTIKRKADVLLIRWLAGIDKHGVVVACLVPATAKDGISPLSDCR